jgi:hypothetical protein
VTAGTAAPWVALHSGAGAARVPRAAPNIAFTEYRSAGAVMCLSPRRRPVAPAHKPLDAPFLAIDSEERGVFAYWHYRLVRWLSSRAMEATTIPPPINVVSVSRSPRISAPSATATIGLT